MGLRNFVTGVFTTSIDSEHGKVTVSGNVDPSVLIKKLAKSGKHAELWGAQKANNNQNNLPNQFKNVHLDNGKGGNNNNNKGQKGANNNNNNNQPKGGGGGGGGQQPNPQQQLQQQLQQLQQMKGLQDLKMPPQLFKDMKLPNMPNLNQNQNQKAVKFNIPDDDEDLSDFDDDEFDDGEFDDDEYDDDWDEPHPPLNKMKPITGNGGPPGMMPNNMMMMMNGNHPQLMNAQKGAPNAAQNAKKGGNSGPVPVQVNMANNEGKNGNGGKKGGGGGGNQNGGNNQSQGGKNGKNGGGLTQDGKNGNNGGGGGGANNKNGNNGGGANGHNMNGNGGKKGNGGPMGDMNGVFQNMGGGPAAMAAANAKMGSMPMGQMGGVPMGQMGNIPAVQGLPAAALNGGAGGGAGYFQGAGPDLMPGNPYHQQQQQQQPYMAAAMMNQQRAIGNERFQPMMYARPPPAVNYMPQHPYPPYPYPQHPYPPQDPAYTHFFSDENTSSCNVM